MEDCSPPDLPQPAEDADLSRLCRACLSSRDVTASLVDSEPGAPPLVRLLGDLADVLLSAGEGLPTRICGTCLQEINSRYRFRTRCQQVDATLRRLLTVRKMKREDEASSGTLVVRQEVHGDSAKNEKSTCNRFEEMVSLDGKNDITQLFGCKYCDFRTELKSEYAMHKAKVHSETKKKKKKISELKYFETLSQTGERMFKCSVCDYAACAKSTVLAHRRSHIAEKPFGCSHCPFRSNFSAGLRAHLRTHTGERPFLCAECPARFTQPAHLAQHAAAHSVARPFACATCGYRAKARRHLDNHLRVHSGERPFLCDACSFRCANKVNLMSHKRSHNTARLFTCELCDYSSNFKKNLAMHVLKHSGVKAFGCDLCDYKGTCAQNLRAHQLSHSKERKFACGECSYRTKTSSMLKKHFKIHNR